MFSLFRANIISSAIVKPLLFKSTNLIKPINRSEIQRRHISGGNRKPPKPTSPHCPRSDAKTREKSDPTYSPTEGHLKKSPRRLRKSSSLVPWPQASFKMPHNGIPSKSSRQWKMQDLNILRVEMTRVSPEQFFGCANLGQLPEPRFIHPQLGEIITARLDGIDDGPPPRDSRVQDLFETVYSVCTGAKESTVDRLAKAVMTYMGYEGPADNKINIIMQNQTYFPMNGCKATARQDLALVDTCSRHLFLFVENKRWFKSKPARNYDELDVPWPHAQVVAHGLGAYNTNMSKVLGYAQSRSDFDPSMISCLGTENCDMVFPAFTFVGSAPCFYLVPMTASFASAVARGEIPPHPTRIFYCPAPLANAKSGMSLKPQRMVVLKMFEAFKHFVPTNITEVCRFSKLGTVVPAPINPECRNGFVWDEIAAHFQDINECCKREGFQRSDYSGHLAVLRNWLGQNCNN